jgi:hypothetical protein
MRASPIVALVAILVSALPAACNQAALPTSEAEPTNADTTYQSPAGYQVVVPGEWVGHHMVQEVPPVDVNARGASSITDFLYTPADSSLTTDALMTVLTYTPEQWSAIAGQGGPPPGDQVAECGSTIVVVAMPQSNPYGSGTPDGATFDQLVQAIDPAAAIACTP